MMMDSGTPCARLCHIVKWDHFDGYGFNLHAEKGKTGQFIGKVDEGSPSEAAGLKQGDRIIEVNEINIANETHKQVVERIKAFPTETKLLVVDQAADDYFKANNVPIKGTMPGVKYMKTPERNFDNDDEEEQELELEMQGSGGGLARDVLDDAARSKIINSSNSNGGGGGSQGTTSDTHSIASSGSGRNSSSSHHQKQHHSSSTTTSQQQNGNGTTTTTRMDSTNNGSSSMQTNNDDNLSTKSSSSSSISKDAIQPASNSNNNNNTTTSSNGSLNLTMSAKELRARLAARKKYDPKKESMGFKDKFDIVQKL